MFQFRNHNSRHNITRLLVWLGAILLSPQAFAANHFVRAGATGTGSGADWTNACTGFTGSCAVASLVRGDTYYVATGTYSTSTFSTATSGTLVITIKGATVADHGTDTGWSSAFSVDHLTDGGTQATFSGVPITFSTSHWVFDGNTSTTLWDQTCADYGFAFSTNDSNVIFGTGVGSTFTDFTVRNTCGNAVTTDTQKEKFQTCVQCGAVSNVTISHNLGTGWQGWVFLKSNGIGATDSNWVFEYNVDLEQFSSANNHAEMIDPDSAAASGMIVRYNLVYGYSGPGGQLNNNCVSNGGTGIIVANNSNNSNSLIYGNVFDTICVGAVVIGGTSPATMSNASIFNNVFANYQSGSASIFCSDTNCSGLVAENNLIYNYQNCNGAGSPACVVGGAGITTDFNAYYSSNNTPTEAHGQTATGNPFVNSAAFNYNLLADTSAGLTLTGPTGCTANVNCYNVDAGGTLRAANGTWDRGALQIAATGTPAVSLLPASVNCGSQNTGNTISCTAVTLTNTGTALLTISGISITGTNPADFSQINTCGATLAQNASCTITPSFTPSATGARSANISVTDNAAGSPQTVALTGTGTSSGSPVASLSPATINFGTVNVNTSSASVPVTLSNTGTAVMGITSISLTGTNPTDFGQINNCPVGSNLGAGSSCTITVTFTPLTSGARSATLSVVDSATGSPHTTTLSGTGLQPSFASQVNGGVKLSGKTVIH